MPALGLVHDRIHFIKIKQDFVDVIPCYFFCLNRSLLCPGVKQELFKFIDPVICFGLTIFQIRLPAGIMLIVKIPAVDFFQQFAFHLLMDVF